MFNLQYITKIIIFALGVLFCGYIAAQENTRLVAVLEPLGNTGVTAINKRSVRGVLEEFITRSSEYKAVDRTYTNQILKEHSYQTDGMVDNTKNLQGRTVATVWKNGSVLYRLTNGSFAAVATSLFVSGGDVYAAGHKKNPQGRTVATVWKNGRTP
jgi:hypothetical protein